MFKNDFFKRVVRYALLAVFVSGLIFLLIQAWTMRNFLADQRLQPDSCNGWEYPTAAKTISLTDHAQYQDFHKNNSAQYLYRPSRTGVFGSTTAGAAIECGGFSPPHTVTNQAVSSATAILSFAGTADLQNTGVVVVESSYDDGQDWNVIDSFVLRGTTDNAINNGYRTYPLGGVTAATLPHLRFRLRYVNPEAYYDTTLLLDGLALDVKFAAKQAAPEQGIFHLFSFEEQPVIIVDQKTLDSVEFLSSDGTPLNLPFVKEIVDGKTRITIQRGATIKPGVYIVRTKSKKFFRAVVQEQSFSFGVLNLNTPKSSYETGDLVPFAIGVLDDVGRTTCNASLTLTVTKPNGRVALFRTSDGSLAGSAECGPESLTNQPDYSAQLIADQPGTYTTHLEVQTDRGPQTMSNTFVVTEKPTMIVARLAPTRINPRTPYVTRLNVTPISDYRGTVVETVPADFAVSNARPDAVTAVSNDRQLIRWDVDWKANQTYELAYTFDAPDVSPAIFTVGPLQIGEFVEPRRWSMSSDKMIREEKAGTAYEKLPVTDADFVKDRKRLVEATKQTFAADENAQIKAYKNGYTLPDDAVPEGLDPKKKVVVENVEVRNPMGTTDHLIHVSEEFKKEGRALEILHLVPQPGFSPGVYTMETTFSDGEKKATETDTFAWGVLVVNPEKSIYLPNETVNIGIAVLDKTGVTLCQADLKLTVTDPTGKLTIFSTTDETITRSYNCDVHSVTNIPDYAASFTAGGVGTYQLELESTIQHGQEKTAVDQTYSIQDSFEVRASVPYDVSRKDTPVRIYPVADYPANFTIIANQDWSGLVSESVPADFRIYDISNGGTIKLIDGGPQQEIVWNVDWQAGQTYTLSYKFDAPDISPVLYALGPLIIDNFHEARQWQIASDATKTWDGGGTPSASWSTCANWDANTCPANTGDSVQFNGTSNNNSDWDAGSSVTSISDFTVTSMSGSITFTKTPVTITGTLSHASTGSVIFAGSASVSVAKNFTLTTSGTFTANTSTLTMTGTSNNFNSAKSFYNLTVNPASTGTINIVTNNPTVTGTLTIAAGDTMAIATGITLTHTGGTLTWGDASSTISGAGTLIFTSTSPGPGTSGVLSSIVRYDCTSVAIPTATIDARTYSGRVEVYSNATALRTVTLPSGNFILSGASSHLYIIAAGSYNLIVTGVTNAPTFTIGGDVDFTGAGSGTEALRTGAGAWSVAGNVDFRDGTLTAAASNTFTMTGASKTLYANGNFYNLTFDPASAGTITIVGGTAITNDLVISADATVTFYDSNAYIDGMATFTLDGTLNGPGMLYYYDGSPSFPTTGTISCVVLFHFSSADLTVPGRTFGGDVWVQGDNVTMAYSLIFGSAAGQTITIAGYLHLDANGTGNVVVDAATYDPTVVIGGDLDYIGVNATGTEVITAGTCPWTVSGNVNFTDGTYTTETGTCNGSGTGSTLIMDGTGTLTSDNETLFNLDINSTGTVTLAAATHTMTGNLLLGGVGTPTVTGSTISMAGSGKTIDGGAKTLNNLTLDGGGTTTLQNTDLTVSGLLNVTSDDTLSLSASRTLRLTATSGTTLTLDGTISGDGRLSYYSSTTFPSTGVISSVLRFVLISSDITIPDRLSEPLVDYGGDVELYSESNDPSMFIVSMIAGTYRYGADIYLYANGDKSVLLSGQTVNPTVYISGNITTPGSGLGIEQFTTGTSTWTVSGNIDLTGGSIAAATGNTIVMDGTSSNTLTTATGSFYNLTIDPATPAAIVIPAGSSPTVTHTLTVANGDTLTITDAASTVTLSATSGTVLVPDGTINGNGRLSYSSSDAFPVGGTLNCVVRILSRYADLMSPRAFGGDLEFYQTGTALATRTVEFADTGELVVGGDLLIIASSGASVTLDVATTPDPDVDVTITGDLDFTGVGSGTEIITAGTGVWDVGGSVDFTNGQYNPAAGNRLKMTGTGTLTSAGQTLQNLGISGTVTLADATHTVAGDLTLTDSTLTPGTSTVTMTGTSNNIQGGGKTLANLTIDPASAGTITIDTSDLSVSGLLTVASSDELAIPANRVLILTGTAGPTLALDGTISGLGRLIYSSTEAFPTGGTITSILRMDTTGQSGMILSDRSGTDYGGTVEFYNNSATYTSITFAIGTDVSQTINFGGNFYIICDGDQGVAVSAATYDPTINITGDLDFTGAGAGDNQEQLDFGDGTWTVGGNVNFTDGVFTANASTLVMSGSGKTLTPDANSINNFEVSGGDVTTVGATDINGTFDTSSSGAFTQAANANLNVAGNFTLASGTTFTAASGSGKVIFDGDLIFNDATDPQQDIGAVEIGTSLDTTDLASDMVTKALTVNAGDVLNTNGYDIDASNNVTVNGTLDATDDVETDETFINCANNFTISSTAKFVQDQSTVIMDAEAGTKLLITDGAFSLYNLTISDGGGSLLVQAQDPLDVDNNLTITGGNFDANSNNLTIGGNWVNSDVFTHGGGTVLFDGSTQQTLSGTMTGSSAFNNLTVTNNSGSDPETSPSVIFLDGATTAATFTAVTENTKLRFAAGATYTFQNVVFNGQSTDTRIFLRSSVTGTQWNLNVAGTLTASNTNVRDSNVCGQAPDINATDGTDFDATNNSCWNINTITFSISDTSIGFGSLSAGAATWATGDLNGSASDTAAHTMNIATNARSGYAITYNGATLTSTTGPTIDAATITNDADGVPGTEQFAIGFSTNGDATIAAGYDHNVTPASRDWKFTPNTITTIVSETGPTPTETISAFYLGNISGQTESGVYSTNVTYIATTTF